ncbi:unnamed protein product [Caenorhabditis auriculariae]|uniref:ADP-ribosylation factor-like protein 6 n=1 Tax=Caenorhabditis auriculariae TaxID=2777116 RepID=A0A8S1H4G9_9PELO|nr:unnamed protein product [Caenorhabditis auriculariae]
MKLLFLIALACSVYAEVAEVPSSGKFSVEGEIILPASKHCSKWSSNARVMLNHGQYIGFVGENCIFRVDNVPSGSYIVQIENVDFIFEPIRVDITGKGKMRARKLTLVQPNTVNQLSYPLKLSARGPTRYFRKREEWRVTDMLMSPMVLMLVVPLLIMLVIPKMTANDPQLQREMEQMQLPKMDMPDVGEVMANFFGGGPAASKKKAGEKESSSRMEVLHHLISATNGGRPARSRDKFLSAILLPSPPDTHRSVTHCRQPNAIAGQMGLFNSLSQLLGLGKKQVSIIVVGLDNSGKTTVLNALRTPDTRTSQIVPTVGYTVTNFTTGNLSFNAFDMAGQGRYRSMWESYYANSQAIVFVVDSSDRLRISLARDELWMIMDHKDVVHRPIPILVLANKMDDADAMSSAEISVSLGLEVIRGHHWTIQATCALNGAGLDKAMQWLSTEVNMCVADPPDTSETPPVDQQAFDLQPNRRLTASASLLCAYSTPFIESKRFPISGRGTTLRGRRSSAMSNPTPPAAPRQDSWHMFPLFYPAATAESISERMLHPSPFDNLSTPASFYSRWPTVNDAAYQEQAKWQTDQIYHLSFPSTEQKPLQMYQTDSFPSTSVAGNSPATNPPLDYRMNPAACYSNNLFGTAYDYPQMQFAWKMSSAVAGKSLPKSEPTKVVPTGPGTNHVRVRTAEKYRMVYSDYQRLELEKEFITNNFITADRKSVLSTQLNLTERQIKIWFQNRRAKGRREHNKKM